MDTRTIFVLGTALVALGVFIVGLLIRLPRQWRNAIVSVLGIILLLIVCSIPLVLTTSSRGGGGCIRLCAPPPTPALLTGAGFVTGGLAVLAILILLGRLLLVRLRQVKVDRNDVYFMVSVALSLVSLALSIFK